MSAVYPEFMGALARGQVNANSATWQIIAVDDSGGLDLTDTLLADVTGTIPGAEATLPSVAVQVNAPFDIVRLTTLTAEVEITGVTTEDVIAFVVYATSGGVSRPAAWLDVRADSGPVFFHGSGESVFVSFPAGWFVQL